VVEFYRKVSEQGNTVAQCNQGKGYQGQGVQQQDRAQTMGRHHKAVRQGDTDTQCNLGECYAKGEGVP
jgi:TPR repeat protein